MVQTEIDNKGRVLIPKAVREQLSLANEETINVFAKDKEHIIIEKVTLPRKRGEDTLDWLLKHPAHVANPKMVSREELEEIEEEMWNP